MQMEYKYGMRRSRSNPRSQDSDQDTRPDAETPAYVEKTVKKRRFFNHADYSSLERDDNMERLQRRSAYNNNNEEDMQLLSYAVPIRPMKIFWSGDAGTVHPTSKQIHATEAGKTEPNNE